MKYRIATKNCVLTNKTLCYVERQIRRFDRFLSGFPSDLIQLEMIVRKNHKRSRNHLEKQLTEREELKIVQAHKGVDSPFYYEGKITVILPKKPLVVTAQSRSIEGVIKIAFLRLERELQRYKGKHFQDYTEYFDRETIRKAV